MKIGIIGAGNVGATCAYLLAQKKVHELVLIDIVPGLAQGKALDLQQASGARITGGSEYALLDGAEILVITAGIPRGTSTTREALLERNARIVREIITRAHAHAPDAIVIMVTNPVDALCHIALKYYPRERVLGSGCLLDSMRFATSIARELGVPREEVDALVIANHGAHMLPLPGHTRVRGKSLSASLSPERVNALVQETREGGAHLAGLIGTSAYYAPAMAIVMTIDAIMSGSATPLPCSVLLQGEYGAHGVSLGVPVLLGPGGVRSIVAIELSDDERAAFTSAAAHVRSLVEDLAR